VRGTRTGFGTFHVADWVVEFNIVVVGLAVRAGPECPHPAQVEDGYAGLCWIAEHADSLNIDRDRLAIAGISGGGGVAAATALYARDHDGPRISQQILILPMLDDRETHPSGTFENVMWNRVSNRTGWAAILGDQAGGADVSPYAAPARAVDLRGLPPAYLDVYSCEVFRDEALDYGARLAQAGVPVELHLWAGGLHGSEGLAPQSELTKAAQSARRSFLRRIFGPSGTGLDSW
jgi:acetyl esterase/lipase